MKNSLTEARSSPVSSHNEWDPLEEVILGSLDFATVPPWHVTTASTMPREAWPLIQRQGGAQFPAELVDPARRELDELGRLLEREQIKVRRPSTLDHARAFSTPNWSSEGGLYAAMPRDSLIVVGNEIIEVPMAWRCRYHETAAFRPLLKEYFQAGARWTSAPKPQLLDELYAVDGRHDEEPPHYAVTEAEPVFDAADFARCGRDIFVQRSHVTNELGIEWMRRHLGPEYRVHVLEVNDSHPMHIDASFIPLAPGKVMINPERVLSLPEMFSTWEILEAPRPVKATLDGFSMCSTWISANTLMLDPERVLVEASEVPLIDAFRRWGFEPIPCTLKNFNRFGGGFHCATLDVRRRGDLQSYF